MLRNAAWITAAVALVAAIAAPASVLAQGGASEATATEKRITVQVNNGHWLDVRVYAVRENGASDKIGTVTSFSSRELELPHWFAPADTRLRLVAVPIGSTERHTSPSVIASGGDVIEWRLHNNLSLSNIFVRSG